MCHVQPNRWVSEAREAQKTACANYATVGDCWSRAGFGVRYVAPILSQSASAKYHFSQVMESELRGQPTRHRTASHSEAPNLPACMGDLLVSTPSSSSPMKNLAVNRGIWHIQTQDIE